MQNADGAAIAVAGIFDASPAATFAIDMQHRITHINQACTTMLGIIAQEVIGTRSLARLLDGGSQVLLSSMIVDAAATTGAAAIDVPANCRRSPAIKGALEREQFFPDMGPRCRWLVFTAAPLRDVLGRLTGAVKTIQDVTDRKHAEQSLLKAKVALKVKLSVAQDQLVNAEKLSSIGQLAAGVAHEINNPIGYIFSNYGSLEKYIDSLFEMLTAYEGAELSHGDPSTVASLRALRQRLELEYLREDIPALMRESREGIERVRKIVQNLKDFSHVDASQEWQFVNLTQCIDSTLNVVNNEIKYRADVIREFAAVPDIECHPSEINQVIMNLLVNAAHAIGTQRGTIRVRLGSDHDRVWFEVEDSGAGIAREHLARIFDPFFTTKPVGKGTGLGLSISYGIVKKHHGQITVRTEVGQGSTFRVTLPVEQRQVGAGTSTDGP
jgi:two-component system NtrC family sensor kinase